MTRDFESVKTVAATFVFQNSCHKRIVSLCPKKMVDRKIAENLNE